MQHRIENLLVIGDSLTDRGTMARSAIAAFSGLYGKSPHGRFTNGYVWLDYFIQQVVQKGQIPEWIQPKTPQKKALFSINNDEYVGTQASPIFARTYCIGGMTAYDYSDVIRPGHCVLNAEAKVLQTLDSMRQEAITDDTYIDRQDNEKQSTLVIEWSGANDLITINEKPTREAAQRAVEARIDNMKALIVQGYRHFVLFNLPDLSLTPRFQNGHADLRDSAADSVLFFNQMLKEKLDEVIQQYPDCKINVFDANALFSQAYHDPEHFGLDKAKRHQPFLDSRAFKGDDSSLTAKDYMFWDDVHPTEALHVQLAKHFYEYVFSVHYTFGFSQQTAIRKFQEAYGMRWEDESHSTCGLFKKSKIDYLSQDLTLEKILQHGLHEKGHRTRKVIQSLGWIHPNGSCAIDHPFIVEAYTNVAPAVEHVEEEQREIQLSKVSTAI